MGGLFGSIARGLAGTGEDLGQASIYLGQQSQQAQQDALEQRLKEIQSKREERRLGLEESAAAQKTPEGIRNLLRGVFGREPTQEELQRYLGVAPKEEKPPGINREGLIKQMTVMAQDPQATPQQKKVWNSLILQALSTPTTDVTGLQRLSDFSDRLMEQWSKPQAEKSPVTKAFGGYEWEYDPENKIKGQVVRGGPGNQWARMGAQKTAAENTPLDSLVYGLASGQVNRWPTGKLLAQVLNRAKELEVTLPKQPGAGAKPPIGAVVAVNNLRKLELNLAQAELIAGQHLTPEPIRSLAKLAG